MALRLAIDTNRYVDFSRGDPTALFKIQSADELYLPFIVIGELRAGFQLGSRVRENERRLTEFLGAPRVAILFADEGTTHHFATLYSELSRMGTPIPINDLWIAALVIQHDLMLFSRDKHFEVVRQIPRI